MADKGKSLRALINECVEMRPCYVLLGTVTKASPLEIQVASDSKLLLDEDNLYLPEHLTKRSVRISLSVGDHYASSMTLDNALRKGDKVYLLSFDRGQLYYILDKV